MTGWLKIWVGRGVGIAHDAIVSGGGWQCRNGQLGSLEFTSCDLSMQLVMYINTGVVNFYILMV